MVAFCCRWTQSSRAKLSSVRGNQYPDLHLCGRGGHEDFRYAECHGEQLGLETIQRKAVSHGYKELKVRIGCTGCILNWAVYMDVDIGLCI